MGYSVPRKRGLYDPADSKPFKLSRSKIDLFLKCPRCFYIDRRLGIGYPPTPGYTLNSAVDALLKTEFDGYRGRQAPHPIMVEHSLDALPFQHEQLEDWRNNFRGVQYLDEKTNLLIFGAVDDIWVRPDGELIVVDYKATAKAAEVVLDQPWHESYKRQMEVYQWLLRQNGFTVSDTGYFLYCNGDASKELFDYQLHFRRQLIPYTGSADWIDDTIKDIHATLVSPERPASSEECDYCRYHNALLET